MVGFAELGPTFDFFKEAKSVFRAMCMVKDSIIHGSIRANTLIDDRPISHGV